MNTDTIHSYQHAGHALSPIADFGYHFAVIFGPGLILGAALTLAWLAARGIYRGIRHLAVRWQARDGLKVLASYANSHYMRTLLDDLKPSRKETP